MTDTRYLRPCLTCGQPLYTVVGQRKRHTECRGVRRRPASMSNGTRSRAKSERDLTEAEIEKRFLAAKAALRRSAA